MKKILTLILLVFTIVSYGQSEKNFTVRNKLTVVNEFELSDSSVTGITSGETLATTDYVDSNQGVTTFLGLTDTESSYTPYEFQVVNAGGTALESPSGLTYNEDLFISNNIQINKKVITDTIESSNLDALSIMAGDKEIARAYGNGIEQFIINPKGDLPGTALAPSLAFGDGNTGFYESVDNTLVLSFGGFPKWVYESTRFRTAGNGLAFVFGTPTATFPVILPQSTDPNTGLGTSSADQLSLIAGGREMFRLSENITEQGIFNPQADYTGTASAPNLAYGDGDTGDYEVSDDVLNKTVAGVVTMQHTEDTTFVYNYLKFTNGSSSSVSFGSDGQIPFMNSGGTDFEYSGTGTYDNIFEYDGDRLILSTNDGSNPLKNVFIGEGAANNFSSSAYTNVIIGNNAGYGINNGDQNVLIGASSGYSLLGGNFNTMIGKDAGYSVANENGNIMIGYQAGYSETGANKLYIENSNSTTPLIGGDFSANEVVINGDLEVTGTISGVMQVVKAQALYTNTSQTTIITLPTDIIVWELSIEVITGFNDTGTDKMFIGVTGENNRYVNGEDISSIIFETSANMTYSNNTNIPDRTSGSTNITFQYTGQNSDATTGEAYVYVKYSKQ